MCGWQKMYVCWIAYVCPEKPYATGSMAIDGIIVL